ncbi:MAG: polysaccharide deacetylase family protein (PEP-CTERM system associated) [Gammaproteobacteria bacterium]
MEPKSLTFTLDLEDHRPVDLYPKRYPDITREILEFLETRGIEATVFVLGRLAHSDPSLIRDIAGRGHEIAFHSFAHVHLTEEIPTRFRNETRDDKKFLEDLTGKAVIGYRAPAFSLTRDSLWAVDIIKDLGFIYSSSVMPARNPIFGFPQAPNRPFRWPNGLLEIPTPIARLGPAVIPFLGGFYLRYLPKVLVRQLLARGDPRQCYWTYCHPYDFDHEEQFYKMDGTSLGTSLLLWFNRKRTFEKLGAVFPASDPSVKSSSFATLIAQGEFRGAAEFVPE